MVNNGNSTWCRVLWRPSPAALVGLSLLPPASRFFLCQLCFPLSWCSLAEGHPQLAQFGDKLNLTILWGLESPCLEEKGSGYLCQSPPPTVA